MKKICFFSFLLIFVCIPTFAQTKWYNPLQTDVPVIQNQGFSDEIGKSYVRLPDRAKDKIRPAVWNLSRNSAGLSIHFYSNAPQIEIRYGVTSRFAMDHMPATGVSGVDLYAINSDGDWLNLWGNYKFGDTITYKYSNIIKDAYHNAGYEYRLYLPLYNTVKWLEIGVPEEASFEFIPKRKEAPVVVYGTSIAQGGCASRPAMGWTNVLERSLDRPVINLGFSGNGRLEKEVLDCICEIDAGVYILDCFPNLASVQKEEVVRLTVEAVKQLRKSHPSVPILLCAHVGYTDAGINSERNALQTRVNEAGKKALSQLEKEGITGLYYLGFDELDMPADARVDYVHLTDFGMTVQAAAYEKKLREILHEPTGETVTTRPVSQRREPQMYEWKKRHNEILSMNESNPPKRVIIGNSIVNYWGGTPVARVQNGPKSWMKYMEPAGFRNLGYGYDRIENVLWRVYHGELDGYEAEEVVIKIGTNNIGRDNDEEIVDGLVLLLKAVQQRQPKAKIKVLGILPRRDKEERVAGLNKTIAEAIAPLGLSLTDVGAPLLGKDGKIDESCFTDGLHPNEKGYGKIVKKICK